MKRNNILENIAKIRKEKGFSQEFVAMKLNMKQAGYGLIENGDRGLQYDTLLQIAVIFDVDVVDIIMYPETYINKTTITQPEKISLTFDLPADKLDVLLNLITGK